MIRATVIAVSLSLWPLPILAQPAPEVPVGTYLTEAPGSTYVTEAPRLFAMFEAMGVYEVLGIMAVEHSEGARAIAEQLFPDQRGADWEDTIARLHTHDRMVSLFEALFPRDALSAEEVAEITSFLQSPPGRRLIAGEVAARRAFLDDGALAAGSAALLTAMETEDVRLDTLRSFNEVNDLIDRNVSGALNARFAFYRGLIDGGAFGGEMDEASIVADVWAQEPEIRQTTVEWLFSFQITAYADLDNADLQAYVDHSETAAGQAVIAALFAAFDPMLEELSYEIGYAAAGFMVGEDI